LRMSFKAVPLSRLGCTRISPSLRPFAKGTCVCFGLRPPSHPSAICLLIWLSASGDCGVCGTELEHPPPDCLVRDVEPTLGEESLNISITEREPQVEPNGVPNVSGWNLETAVRDGLRPRLYCGLAEPVSCSRDKAARRVTAEGYRHISRIPYPSCGPTRSHQAARAG
jgi:hypothetical protein